MKRIVLYLVIALSLLVSFISTTSADDRTIPITFSVTNTGINRFIASQWSSSTKSWNITNQGVWCSIQLLKPSVSLYSNTIKINLAVTVVAIDISTDLPIYVNQTFRFTPTLTIPPTTISMDKIYSQYTDLVAAIAGAIPDTRVQVAVAQALSPISWVIYQGKALNESTARWTEGSDIGWKVLPTLTFSVANDEVNLTITPTLYSNPPSYTFQWMRETRTKFGIRVYSNNQFTLDLTNNLITLLNGTSYSVTVTSTLPVQATYDAGQQKYMALLTFTTNSTVAYNLGWVNIKLKINRANIETLWTFSLYTTGTSEWTYINAQVTPIRGE